MVQVGSHHGLLLTMCALRWLFIPAFLFCKEQVWSVVCICSNVYLFVLLVTGEEEDPHLP